jgi:hypothetical protein
MKHTKTRQHRFDESELCVSDVDAETTTTTTETKVTTQQKTCGIISIGVETLVEEITQIFPSPEITQFDEIVTNYIHNQYNLRNDTKILEVNSLQETLFRLILSFLTHKLVEFATTTFMDQIVN